MKKIMLLCTALLALAASASAQSVTTNDTMLARFVNRTITDIFDYAALSRISDNTKNLVFQTDLPKKLIIPSLGRFPVIVIPKDADLRKRKYRELIKNTVFNIFIDKLGADTLDVNLVGTHYYIKGRKVCGEIECGGDMGYIPSGRFVLDAETGLWNYISRKTIYEEKCREIEEQFKGKK